MLWPEATPERSTVALLLEVDPIALVRGRGNRGADSFALAQYVNDRPYAASSMLAVALGRVFRTAMSGRCDARPELVGQLLPLEVHVPALRSGGGADLVERLFSPLGWTVRTTTLPLDPDIPTWGDSPYVDLRLTGEVRVADALTQLYVLLPALDDSKHYWVGADEVEKLLRAGAGWLSEHPERELITKRFLGHHRELVRSAVSRLAEVDDAVPDAFDDAVADEPDRAAAPLAVLRKQAVLAALLAEGRPAWSTSAAARARCCGPSSATPLSPRSSASTCRPARWRSPNDGSAWTGCRTASGPGCGCCSPR